MAGPTRIASDGLAGLLQPGQRIYVPGSSGAPLAFMDAVLADPANSAGLHLTTSYVPGINALDMDRLADDVRVSGLFMQAGFGPAQQQGRFAALPSSYAGFVRQIHDGPAFDLCVAQLSPPDADGRCSLGPLAEFTPAAAARSQRVLAIINPNVPRIAGAAHLRLADLDYVCEADTELPTYSVRHDDIATAIAHHLAGLIPDGASVQMGLGAVPNALYPALANHRQLRLHSGMFSDGLLHLHASGALDAAFSPATCALVGSASFYSAAAELPGLQVRGCEHTHDPRTLLALPRFHAVNSAMEVDLFGQCNLEHANGRAVSGVGGAPDFARAARLSPGGCSIIALPSTHGRQALSRIVAQLPAGTPASLARCDVDCVVTEHGIAHLKGRSVHERAHALIAIAAPAHRDALAQAWDAMAARL